MSFPYLRHLKDINQKQGQKISSSLSGEWAWDYQDVERYLSEMKFKDEVVQIPHSLPERIAEWMASATALVLVSNYEGFGIPIVEAMACGVPVICSDVSSMPEVAGNAAITVNPEDISAISIAMNEVTQEEIKKNLVSAGKDRIGLFSWDRSAEKLWEALEGLIRK